MIPSSRLSSAGGPVEVVGGQQPQRDDLDAELVAPLEQRRDVGGAGPVAVARVAARRPAQRRLPSSITPTCLGSRSVGQPAHDPRFVGGVEHPSEPALPVRHGEQPYSVERPGSGSRAGTVRCMSPPHRTTRPTPRPGVDRAHRRAGRARPSTRSSRSCAAGCTPASAPLTLAAGIVLVALSPTASTRIGVRGLRDLGAAAVHGVRRSTTAAPGARACGGSCGASTTPTSSC